MLKYLLRWIDRTDALQVNRGVRKEDPNVLKSQDDAGMEGNAIDPDDLSDEIYPFW